MAFVDNMAHFVVNKKHSIERLYWQTECWFDHSSVYLMESFNYPIHSILDQRGQKILQESHVRGPIPA